MIFPTSQAILAFIAFCEAALVVWLVYDRRKRETSANQSIEMALKSSSSKFRSLFENVLEGVYQSTPNGKLLTVNPALVRMFGYDSEQDFFNVDIARDLYVDPEERKKHLRHLEKYGELRNAELRLCRKDGSVLVVLENSRAVLDEKGNTLYYEGTLTDITGHKRVQQREQDRHSTLELMAGNEKLEIILASVAAMVEHQFPALMAGIDLVEEGRLYSAAAPSLPPGFAAAMEGLPVGPAAASAGTAAHLRRVVVTGDIEADPLWAGFREIALQHKIRAAWSAPIALNPNRVVGTLTVYATQPLQPDREILDLMDQASQLAAIAIDRRRLTDLLTFQAQHDAVTRLPNRFLFTDRLEQALLNARRNQKAVALLYIDLDDFKLVNDTLGHAAGDNLLCQVAERFLRCVRSTDTVARTGGDEFTAIGYLDEVDGAQQVAEKLLRCLQHPFEIEGRELHVSASIGISVFPQDGEEAETLQQHADRAMYRAKKRGKNAIERFSAVPSTGPVNQADVTEAIIRKLNKIEIVLTRSKQERQLR